MAVASDYAVAIAPCVAEADPSDVLRSAARRHACAAGFGKPEELRARNSARVVVGERARDKVRCDLVVDACGQNIKGGAPVE